MTPDTLLDTAYRFFGDAAIASMVSFLIARFVGTNPGSVVAALVTALQDGKISPEEISKLKALLGGAE